MHVQDVANQGGGKYNLLDWDFKMYKPKNAHVSDICRKSFVWGVFKSASREPGKDMKAKHVLSSFRELL